MRIYPSRTDCLEAFKYLKGSFAFWESIPHELIAFKHLSI